MKIKHYVEYYYPGIIVGETSEKEIEERDENIIKVVMPKQAYGFKFFDMAFTEEAGIKFKSDRVNESSMYYPNAQVLDENDVRNQIPNNSILLSNMRGNNWSQVVRTRTGTIQPFRKNDKIII